MTFWSSSFLGTETSSESHSSNCTLERGGRNDNRNQQFFSFFSDNKLIIMYNSALPLYACDMGGTAFVLLLLSGYPWGKDSPSCLLKVNDKLQSGHPATIPLFSVQPTLFFLVQYSYTQRTVHNSFTHFPDSRRIFKPSGGICRVTYTRGKVDISLCELLVRPSAIFSWETEICWSRRSAIRLHHIAMAG